MYTLHSVFLVSFFCVNYPAKKGVFYPILYRSVPGHYGRPYGNFLWNFDNYSRRSIVLLLVHIHGLYSPFTVQVS